MIKKFILLMSPFLIYACVSKEKNANNSSQAGHRIVSIENSETPNLDNAILVWVKHSHSSKVELRNNKDLSPFAIIDLLKTSTDENKLKSEILFELNSMANFFEALAGMVKEFDQKVKNKAKKKKSKKEEDDSYVDLAEDPDYQRILSARETHERFEDEFRLLYSYSLKMMRDNHSNAIIALSTIKEFLAIEKKKTFTIVAHNISLLMQEVNELAIKDGLDRFIIEVEKIIDTLKEKRSYVLNAISKDLSKNVMRNLNEKVNRVKKALDTFKSPVSDREPQSEDRPLHSQFEGGQIKPGFKPEVPETFKPTPPASTQETGPFMPGTDKNGQLTGRTFNKGEWAITLDDGPSKYTAKFLENLNKDENGNPDPEKVKNKSEKYTFFWLSKLISHPNLKAVVARASSEFECERASHSYSHANLSSSKTDLNHEIIEALDVFENEIKNPATMFRCPYGACGENGRNMLAEKGLIHIFWNVDSLDWQDKDPVSIVERVKDQMSANRRGVILFHDIHPQSVEASNEILKYIRKEKLKLVTIAQKIKDSGREDFTSP